MPEKIFSASNSEDLTRFQRDCTRYYQSEKRFYYLPSSTSKVTRLR